MMFGALSLMAVLLAAPTVAQTPRARHLAVLVGANEAPAGRSTLRFAHRDAERLRDTLVRVGGVAAEDAILLLDPKPADVVAALQRVSATARAEPRETILYFYYSGHADESQLYPHGEALPIADVRQALVNEGATVRVGIFDACRGGAWTRAKGLSAAPPVDIRPAWALTSEGTVLFASSSGLEEAHESDRLQGSFFTHHLIGGLLGAADTTGDGAVSATEAFQYAQAQTVRDSARASLEPQHPSFEINLHGRKDLVLAQLESSPSTLAVEQMAGPLQVIELPLGLVLLEIPEGKRSTKLAVAPGAYLIRRVSDSGVVTAREVQVAAGATTVIDESSLTLVGDSQLERKGEGPLPAVQRTILPKGKKLIGVSTGVSYSPGHRVQPDGLISFVGFAIAPALDVQLAWSPLEWLEVSVISPGVSVLFGTRQENELLLAAGLQSIGYSNLEGAFAATKFSAAYRHWFSPRTSLAVTARYILFVASNTYPMHEGKAGFLFSHTVRDVFSLNFAVSATGWPTQRLGLTLGSGWIGAHKFPLLQLHLTPAWSINFDASVSVTLQPEVQTGQSYLAGFTYNW